MIIKINKKWRINTYEETKFLFGYTFLTFFHLKYRFSLVFHACVMNFLKVRIIYHYKFKIVDVPLPPMSSKVPNK